MFGAFLLKLHVPIAFREQSVIATKADVNARVYTSTTLSHDDIAGNDLLSAKYLDAQSLGL